MENWENKGFDTKEEYLKYRKDYYNSHKEQWVAYKNKNKEKIRIQCREYYHKNKIYQNKVIERSRLFRDELHDKRFFSGNRLKALKRDRFKCRICSREDKIVVHHIDGNGRGVEKHQRNNDLSNLLTLCCYCHRKIHNN